MSTSCGWEAKAGMAHSDWGWTCGCAGKTVKSLENTCHTGALLRWWFTTKRRYIKCMHLFTFGRSASKGVGINRGNFGMGRGWTPGSTSLLHMCYSAKFVRFRSSGTSVIAEIRPKKMTLASCLSRSLKVIRTDTDRSATHDFLFTFHNNHGPISYRFWDKRRYQSKIANFSNPRLFNAPAEKVPWNLVSALGDKNENDVATKLPDWERSFIIGLSLAVPFGYNTRVWQTDRQTDRQTPADSKYRAYT